MEFATHTGWCGSLSIPSGTPRIFDGRGVCSFMPKVSRACTAGRADSGRATRKRSLFDTIRYHSRRRRQTNPAPRRAPGAERTSNCNGQALLVLASQGLARRAFRRPGASSRRPEPVLSASRTRAGAVPGACRRRPTAFTPPPGADVRRGARPGAERTSNCNDEVAPGVATQELAKWPSARPGAVPETDPSGALHGRGGWLRGTDDRRSHEDGG